MSTRTRTLTAFGALALAAGLSAGAASVQAQGGYADRALKQLIGTWGDAKGRTITFRINDNYNAVFDDEFEPGLTLTGSYRQDDSGAGYVLIYPRGAGKGAFLCRYNVNVTTGADGNEVVFRLVESTPERSGRFRCIQGPLKRTRR